MKRYIYIVVKVQTEHIVVKQSVFNSLKNSLLLRIASAFEQHKQIRLYLDFFI